MTAPGSRRDRVLATCEDKPGSAEDYPFGDGAAVFKVAGRMFALVSLGPPPGSVSLKCDPRLAEDLRARYAAITPGYHLNKRHWNTVIIDGSLPDRMIKDMIEDSYDLIVSKLPRSRRRALGWESRDVA